MHLLSAKTEPPHLVEDLVGGLGPFERLALLIVRVDVREDGRAQFRDARVGSAPQSLLGEQAKEALHEVQPRCIRGREVKVEARMPEQPAMHHGRAMRREVVQHHVNVERGFNPPVDLAQKRDEVLRAMPRFAAGEDFARRDVQGGKEVERAVAKVRRCQ